MMAAIDVRNLSKRYLLHPESPSVARHLLPRLFGMGPPPKELWALHDVTFQVEEGETFGIIGQNGAGKSTLLKILSGVTKPTSGTIAVDGRVASLLDLGAGFHPDLTGRENIYLNGAILGLSRKNIDRKFNDIVEFAEIGEFLDVPLRTYSSGMNVRLGFSIAVHVDPRILILDEVLAVGDASFQRKSFDKILSFKKQGRTIILVSHSLDQILSLCDSAAWLDKGVIRARGEKRSVVDRYLRALAQEEEAQFTGGQVNPNGIVGSDKLKEIELKGVKLFDANGSERHAFQTGEEFVVQIAYHARLRVERPNFGIAIHRADGTYVTGTNTELNDYNIDEVVGSGEIYYRVLRLLFNEGTYFISVTVNDHAVNRLDQIDFGYEFTVIRGVSERSVGIIHLPCEWELRSRSRASSGDRRNARQ